MHAHLEKSGLRFSNKNGWGREHVTSRTNVSSRFKQTFFMTKEITVDRVGWFLFSRTRCGFLLTKQMLSVAYESHSPCILMKGYYTCWIMILLVFWV